MNIPPSVPPHQPQLPARLLEPSGLLWGSYDCSDGIHLRWCALKPANAWAQAIVAVGFAEFIEKYFELMTDLAAAGIAVWCFDWRGQGLSDRHGARPAPRNFARDVTDLAALGTHLLSPERPRVLIAHSMGAALGLRMLAAHPGLFDAAVLSAPMVGVATGALPLWLARIVARAGVGLGFEGALIPGLARIAPDRDIRVEDSLTSHDPVRCTLMQQWFRTNAALTIEGVTFGWYDSALRFCDGFADHSPFQTLTTPILLGTAGHDVFVRNTAIETLLNSLPCATRVHYPDAKHELFHERDDIRAAWLKAAITFLRSSSAKAAA